MGDYARGCLAARLHVYAIYRTQNAGRKIYGHRYLARECTLNAEGRARPAAEVVVVDRDVTNHCRRMVSQEIAV